MVEDRLGRFVVGWDGLGGLRIGRECFGWDDLGWLRVGWEGVWLVVMVYG